jgi:phytoene dehydrogenase-like protein
MGEIDGAFRAWGVPRAEPARSPTRSEAALGAGVEIRTEAGVSQIKTTAGKATGVTLESGEEIEADVVMSSLDSRWTFIKLLEDGVLDPAFRTR